MQHQDKIQLLKEETCSNNNICWFNQGNPEAIKELTPKKISQALGPTTVLRLQLLVKLLVEVSFQQLLLMESNNRGISTWIWQMELEVSVLFRQTLALLVEIMLEIKNAEQL